MTRHRSNELNEKSGWLSKTSNKNARRALKKQTRPASKRDQALLLSPVAIVDDGRRETEQQQPTQKEAGAGKGLRNYRHKLAVLERNNARPRSILQVQKKIGRLERDLEARKQLAEEKATKEAQYFEEIKGE